MKIIFKNKDLERCAIDESFALKHMGKKRADLYRIRLRSISAARNFSDLVHYPGHFHALKGDRQGQWACNLDQPYRLILAGYSPDTITIWEEITETDIIEIVNYH